MPTLEILVGMIASGKSTYARKRADEGALVISHDDLTEMYHQRYRYEQEKRALYRDSEEALADVVLEYGLDLVIDRTHLTRESRQRWLDYARSTRDWCSGLEIKAIVFPIDHVLRHATRRFQTDARGRSFEDWLAVAKHHAEQATAEPIDESEGFDEIRRVDHTGEPIQ